jgi:multiple sugar transport system substrate-binding protein
MSRRPRLLVLMFALALVAAACGGGGDGGGAGTEGGGGAGGEGDSIVFWTTEDLPERMEVQRGIAEAFTEETGIQVEVTAVAEDDLPNLMITNAASGDLPDAVFHGLDFAHGWAAEGLIDPEAANEVVEELGPDTFSAPALELATVDDQVVSVPGDGWGMLTVYRSDLFEEAGLEPPETFEQILTAAEALHDPNNNMNGITLATDPADVFTQQTFEYLALANGCNMVDDSGEVTLGSPQCAEAIEFYTTLVNDYSPGGAQTVDTTRETYFAGQAAMILWSPFILDEMAGLRDDALPTCPECEEDPAFLAKNSGTIGPLSGGGSEPAQYGQISYFGIGADANVEAAQQFIQYLLTDGYVDWLSMSPEGKFPMRPGTAEDPETFINQWRELEAGVDRKALLTDTYSEDVLTQLQEGVDNFQRWGFAQGAGEQVTQLYETLVVPQTLNEVIDGGLEPQQAAEQIASELE